jgi:hypothetical protein
MSRDLSQWVFIEQSSAVVSVSDSVSIHVCLVFNTVAFNVGGCRSLSEPKKICQVFCVEKQRFALGLATGSWTRIEQQPAAYIYTESGHISGWLGTRPGSSSSRMSASAECFRWTWLTVPPRNRVVGGICRLMKGDASTLGSVFLDTPRVGHSGFGVVVLFVRCTNWTGQFCAGMSNKPWFWFLIFVS